MTDFGVFVQIEEGVEGLIHVSQLSTDGPMARHVEDLGVDVAQDLLVVEGDGDVVEREDGVAVGVGVGSHGGL